VLVELDAELGYLQVVNPWQEADHDVVPPDKFRQLAFILDIDGERLSIIETLDELLGFGYCPGSDSDLQIGLLQQIMRSRPADKSGS
jgi:hypothetical protein